MSRIAAMGSEILNWVWGIFYRNPSEEDSPLEQNEQASASRDMSSEANSSRGKDVEASPDISTAGKASLEASSSGESSLEANSSLGNEIEASPEGSTTGKITLEPSISGRNAVDPSAPPPLRVLLFGRTGGGKSTVANVLVTGGIKPEKFVTSDSARACTAEIQTETGCGFTVTDTVGLGESEAVNSSIVTAKKKLIDFLKQVKDEYSLYVYVKTADKWTEMDELIWVIFSSIFEGAENAFVVLFTGKNATEEWLQTNRSSLPDYLRNQKMLVANIPPFAKGGRPHTERKMKDIRQKTIEDLPKNLVKLFNEKGNIPSAPEIAQMTPTQLEEKSEGLYRLIVDTIKRLYNQIQWQTVAAKLGTLINVVDLVINLMNMS